MGAGLRKRNVSHLYQRKGPTCYCLSYNTMGGKHLKSHFLRVYLFASTLTPLGFSQEKSIEKLRAVSAF